MASTTGPQEHLPDYAAATNPHYQYVPNKGYISNPHADRFADAPETAPRPEEDEDEYSDDDDEDLFDDELNDQDWTESGGGYGGGDFTKSYNRQRRIIEATNAAGGSGDGGGGGGAVKGNKHKPKANTAARVDDQIQSLTKFAARIKLGDVESGMGSSKGDRYVVLSSPISF